MKVFLLHPDRDFDHSAPLPMQADDVTQDLSLGVLFEAMAQRDEFLFRIARQVVLSPLDEVESIVYRQDVLRDCLKHPDVVRRIYRIPLEFIDQKRKQWLWVSPRYSTPGSVLDSGRALLEVSLGLLRELRSIADQNADVFDSHGLRRFFTMIQEELDDEYLAVVERHIQQLRFPQGVLLCARLGTGNEGSDYTLCSARDAGKNRLQRLLASRSPSYSYALHPRDDAGARVLGELRGRGLARAANAVAQAAKHIESFFTVLQRELAFYIGCLNLYERLVALGEPIAFPRPAPLGARRFSCSGLYDVTLALAAWTNVVGNDVRANDKSLVVITGPNRGGKTVFLRSVGVAQLMMQCGMFVPAESFEADLAAGLFTHFRREEDKTMERGKFEEELGRMSAIVEHLAPNALVLLNESLAATNEREGSEIAKQIVSALLEKNVKVMYVTHLYEFASSLSRNDALFLRAERLPDGTRTFRLKEAEPRKTSHGEDLYRAILAAPSEAT